MSCSAETPRQTNSFMPRITRPKIGTSAFVFSIVASKLIKFMKLYLFPLIIIKHSAVFAEIASLDNITLAIITPPLSYNDSHIQLSHSINNSNFVIYNYRFFTFARFNNNIFIREIFNSNQGL